jgi:hypothetical protein
LASCTPSTDRAHLCTEALLDVALVGVGLPIRPVATGSD